MNNVDSQYLKLLKDTYFDGVRKSTRSGDVVSVFGRMVRFHLKDGLPVLTTKKMFTRGCLEELLWFLKGSTNIKYLVERNVHIWDDDAYRYYRTIIEREHLENSEYYVKSKGEFLYNVKNSDKCFTFKEKDSSEVLYHFGDLGPVYGKQWRSYGVSGKDQIAEAIDKLKNNPDDRRILVIAYNPDVLDKVALPPCHIEFQFYSKPLSSGKRELSCIWRQRSVDECLGLPYNILSYAVLTHMIAQVCDMEVGDLIGFLGDCHIYMNQFDGVREQLTRNPYKYDLPKLWLNPEIKNIDDFKYDDIKIENYESYPKIFFPLSVG